VTCAIVDCPSVFVKGPPERTGKKCVDVSGSLDSCCGGESKCDAELDGLHTCFDGNNTYYEGEKFTPSRDKCATCICKPGFDADDTRSEFCRRHECYLHRDARMKKGCVPAFTKDNCCPWSWVCPDEVEVKTEEKSETEDKLEEDQVATNDEEDKVKAVKESEDGEASSSTSLPILKPVSPCDLEKIVGRCRAKKPVYYYDKDTKTCRLFFYGGCGGNNNRFSNLGDCLNTCDVDAHAMKAIRVGCTKPGVHGNCDTTVPRRRHFFNSTSGRCEGFEACGETLPDDLINNFGSRDECLLTCQFSLKNGGVISTGRAFPVQVHSID
jgi:hypothetical protein